MSAEIGGEKSFTQQMLAYFGTRPGEAATAFGRELKALNDQEKQEFARLLGAAGFPCRPPVLRV